MYESDCIIIIPGVKGAYDKSGGRLSPEGRW